MKQINRKLQACIIKLDLLISKHIPQNLYFSYSKKTGYWIQKVIFKRFHGYTPNLRNPKSFSEKSLYSKLYERDSRLVVINDKACVREYIAKEIGDKYLVQIHGIFDTPDDIPFDKLPEKFVLRRIMPQEETSWLRINHD